MFFFFFFNSILASNCSQPFNRQPHKMVKHTQAICLLTVNEFLSVFDHFVGLALKRLIEIYSFAHHMTHI